MKPNDCECLLWSRAPGEMKSAKGADLEPWQDQHHVGCPHHPDNDGKWYGFIDVSKLEDPVIGPKPVTAEGIQIDLA